MKTLACWLIALPLALTTAGQAPAADTPVDSMAQRMQVCAACHGREGRAASDGYHPRIAGKPQAYLYRQLLNFREQRRGYAPMVHLVKHLFDDDLREIARYFAQLDLPYPSPQPGPTTPQALARGAELVKRGDAALALPSCVSCHGAAMTGVLPDVPGLVGLPRDYLNAQLGAWKTGLRKASEPDCMARVAARLGPQDIAAISQWLASQPVPADARAAKPGATPASPAPGGPTPPACGGLASIDGQTR